MDGCGLQGVVRAALVSPGTLTTVGVVTTTYSVILPFVHDNNNLSALFRNHWKEVRWCTNVLPPCLFPRSHLALPRCIRGDARLNSAFHTSQSNHVSMYARHAVTTTTALRMHGPQVNIILCLLSVCSALPC